MAIHLHNLGQNITTDSLEILISTYGQVVSASLVPHQDTVPKNAIVKMRSDAEARAAVARLNGSVIDGRIVRDGIIARY